MVNLTIDGKPISVEENTTIMEAAAQLGIMIPKPVSYTHLDVYKRQQEGSTATQGLELFTLVSNQDVKVRLEVPANDYENLIKGSKAQITIGRADVYKRQDIRRS